MIVITIIKNLGFSSPITGLVLFMWGVQSQMLNIDPPGGDFADEDVRLPAGILHCFTGQYKGRTL